MSVVIKGFDKPASCRYCPFNHSDCWCGITEGGIDRDDYSCDLPCPIKSLDDNITNGDVFKQIFKFQNEDDDNYEDYNYDFTEWLIYNQRIWWNAPYREGEEDGRYRVSD